MTQTLVRDSAGSSDAAEGPLVSTTLVPRSAQPVEGGATRKRRKTAPIVLQIVAMIGLGAILYPSAANWFSSLQHQDEIAAYVEAVDTMPTAEREAALAAARDYNAHLPNAVLRDPYADDADADVSDVEESAAYAAYERVLRVSGANGTSTNAIGEVSMPGVGIGLPLFPGTSEQSISKGAGHLYGSSLPIGGPSTHAVLTSHSGLVHASLFSRLEDAEIGDTFSVTTLGETRYYEINSIETVLPEQTESLRIVDGEDLVTLFTCTPIGVNSHRLLVQGVRIDAPAADGPLAMTGNDAGFPWWAVIFVGGSAAVAYLFFAPPRSHKREARTNTQTNEAEAPL